MYVPPAAECMGSCSTKCMGRAPRNVLVQRTAVPVQQYQNAWILAVCSKLRQSCLDRFDFFMTLRPGVREPDRIVAHLLWPRQDSELATRGPDRIAHRRHRPRQNRRSGAAAPTESRVRSGGPDKGVSCTDGPDKSVGHTATAPIEP